MRLVFAYFVTIVVFVVIDMVWLGWVARSTYASELGPLVRAQFDYRAALAFYLLYAAGLMFFAIMPALEVKSVLQGLMLGAGLGLVAYGTYDLTNLAVINGFGARIALIDLAWGVVLSGVSAGAVVFLVGRFN
jgi:uncharacterized membrane protein